MEYNGILIPKDIEDMMLDATPADRRRLAIIGAMRTFGIFERTHTTHLNIGITVFRFGVSVQNDRVAAKELIVEWIQAVYGMDEVSFHQDTHEQKASSRDRTYFHTRAVHKK